MKTTAANNAVAAPVTQGTIRIFQISGISVFLHWSWFLVAVYEIQQTGRYSSMVWSVLEYLALFAIVTAHEFGHALACRKVGGRADRIVLWPLGGVAYVSPPQRPGATLWSIAAGPLVNVALMPVLGVFAYLTSSASTGPASNLGMFFRQVNLINLVLFVFNVLPLYPLDGGKILRSLLWYWVGRAQSLMVTVIIGFAGVAGLGLLALLAQSIWIGFVAAYAGIQCFNGYKQAQALKRLAALPRRAGLACPSCKTNPPTGALWVCTFCRTPFDTFETNATCPKCAMVFPTTTCLDCGNANPIASWPSTATFEPVPNSTAPSIVPIVLGITACAVALVLLLASLLFFKVSADNVADQAGFKAEIERLWISDGLPVTTEKTLTLGGERYDVYIETSIDAVPPKDEIDIKIVNAQSRVPVSLTTPVPAHGLENHDRKLWPLKSFSVPVPGQYTVTLLAKPSSAPDAPIKIGPSVGLVTGGIATVGRGLGIAAGVLALLLIAIAIMLFRYSGRRRRNSYQARQHLYEKEVRGI